MSVPVSNQGSKNHLYPMGVEEGEQVEGGQMLDIPGQIRASYFLTNNDPAPIGLHPGSSHASRSGEIISFNRIHKRFGEKYYMAWAHLAIATIHSIGAFYLFLQPLSFNIFGIFLVGEVYYACLTLDEYLTSFKERRIVTYEKLLSCTMFLVVANAFFAVRYLSLLIASPYYCLAIVSLSATLSLVNHSRYRNLEQEQLKLINRRI